MTTSTFMGMFWIAYIVVFIVVLYLIGVMR